MAIAKLPDRLEFEVEEYFGSSSVNSVEPWELRVAQAQARRDRIQASNVHGERKHLRALLKKKRSEGPSPYKFIPLTAGRLILRKRGYKGSDDSRESGGVAVANGVYRHTNKILEYFEFADGSERAQFLRGFNGDYQYGAGMVRSAYSLGSDFGVFDMVGNAKRGERELFIAIAQYTHKYGVARARALMELVGPEKFEHFSSFVAGRVGSEICLIGGKNNDKTATLLEEMVRKWNGPNIMEQHDYNRTRIDGFVVYSR